MSLIGVHRSMSRAACSQSATQSETGLQACCRMLLAAVLRMLLNAAGMLQNAVCRHAAECCCSCLRKNPTVC